MYIQTNYVKIAINRVGGPTKASNLLQVSNGAIHHWSRNKRVPNIDLATKLALYANMSVEQVRPV